MKHFYLLIAIFLAVSRFGAAQTLTWPELQMQQPFFDSVYIHALIEKGDSLRYSNPDSSLAYYTEAKDLSFQHHYIDGIAQSFIRLSYFHIEDRDLTKAVQYLKAAWPYCLRASDGDLFMLHWYRLQFVIYKAAGQADSAMSAMMRSIPLAERTQDTFYTVQTYGHIGSILIDNQDYERAEPYIRKAIAMTGKQTAGRLASLLNLAYVYAHRERSDSMFLLASQAYEGAKKMQFPQYERSASLLLNRYYLEKGEKEKAAGYAENAIRLQGLGGSDSKLNVYRILSMSYKKTGDHKQALEYGRLAMNNLKTAPPGRRETIALYGAMADLYYTTGNSDSAYLSLLQYIRLNDSVNFTARNETIDRLERQFRLAEKDKQLLQEEAKVRSRDIWILGISAGTLVVILLWGLFFNFYRSLKRKMELLEQQKKIDELRAILSGEEKERNRMAKELHDGVGGLLTAAALNLNNLKEKNDPLHQNEFYDKVEGLISEISQEVRRTAHNLMPDILTENNLQQAIKLYCGYINKHFGLNIKVQTSGDFQHFDPQFRLSVYRIVQELVQNILKHAKATVAMVQLQHSGDLVSIAVEDNGAGFDIAEVNKGVGLRSVSERVAAFRGSFSVNATTGTGTFVYIEFETKHISPSGIS